MKYKYAIYSSGNSSRILEFYKNKDNIERFKPTFIYYDGINEEVINKLTDVIGANTTLITPTEISNSRKELSKTVNKDLLLNLTNYKIDYMFCFGNKILKTELVSAYQNKIINFHPSILPAFKGINAIDQALNTSVQLLGNTAHFIDEGIDTGSIILQSILARNNYVNYYSVLDLQIPMLEKIWKWLENDQIIINNNLVEIKDEINKAPFFSA